MPATINIEQLRVGMFIHLDLGWWAHPFALSSFLVTSTEQVQTIRSLGLKRLRWSPERSLLEPEATVAAPVAAAAGAESDDAAPDLPADAVGGCGDADAGDADARAANGAPARRRAALAEQHEAARLCQRQYGEAAQAWSLIVEAAGARPQIARETAEALTQSLLSKMLVDQDMCIRVLCEGAGDRSTLHALNVAVISMLLGRVFGFDAQDMLDTGLGAMLHDIGKLDLPARVRHADASFTAAEQSAYRSHVTQGIAQAQRMGLSPGAATVIAQHHEFADGSGFPARAAGAQIAAPARIVALVNRYDNLCNPLLPHQALTPHEAVSLLFTQSKNKFDVTMLGAFIRMMGVYPPGSAVQLTDGRYGLVVGVNSSRPLKPRVLVHDPAVAAEEALLLNLEAVPDLGIRRSVKPAALPIEAQDYLSPRQRIVYFFEPQPARLATEQAA